MNHQRTIASVRTGYRTILATQWPVESVVIRVALPGKRISWEVLHGLCNGAADYVETYRTKREALRALPSEGLP